LAVSDIWVWTPTNSDLSIIHDYRHRLVTEIQRRRFTQHTARRV